MDEERSRASRAKGGQKQKEKWKKETNLREKERSKLWDVSGKRDDDVTLEENK